MGTLDLVRHGQASFGPDDHDPLSQRQGLRLGEYDSAAVLAAIHPEPLPRPDTPKRPVLLSCNGLPHLEQPGMRNWET